MDFKKKTSSTIPFGYKFSKNKKYLIPIKSQLNFLKDIKIKILNNNISLRLASIEIRKKTGRNFSHVALSKSMRKDYPDWSIKKKNQILEVLNNKRAQIALEKKRKKEERDIKRLTTESSQKRFNKICSICKKLKILNNFQLINRNRATYCKECYKLILKGDSKVIVKCNKCNQNYKLNELAGPNSLKAFKRKICYPCQRIISNKWKSSNLEKIRRYKLKNQDDIKQNKNELW